MVKVNEDFERFLRANYFLDWLKVTSPDITEAELNAIKSNRDKTYGVWQKFQADDWIRLHFGDRLPAELLNGNIPAEYFRALMVEYAAQNVVYDENGNIAAVRMQYDNNFPNMVYTEDAKESFNSYVEKLKNSDLSEENRERTINTEYNKYVFLGNCEKLGIPEEKAVKAANILRTDDIIDQLSCTFKAMDKAETAEEFQYHEKQLMKLVELYSPYLLEHKEEVEKIAEIYEKILREKDLNDNDEQKIDDDKNIENDSQSKNIDVDENVSGGVEVKDDKNIENDNQNTNLDDSIVVKDLPKGVDKPESFACASDCYKTSGVLENKNSSNVWVETFHSMRKGVDPEEAAYNTVRRKESTPERIKSNSLFAKLILNARNGDDMQHKISSVGAHRRRNFECTHDRKTSLDSQLKDNDRYTIRGIGGLSGISADGINLGASLSAVERLEDDIMTSLSSSLEDLISVASLDGDSREDMNNYLESVRELVVKKKR